MQDTDRIERLRRWGIDPTLPTEEIVRLLSEQWAARREEILAERKADEPVIVDTGGGKE